MANSYSDTTGVLVAKTISPVIKAIFGGFRLEEGEDGEGTIGFRVIAENENMQWDTIISELQTHAEELGFAVNDDELPDAAPEDVLWFLAGHYKVAANEDLCALIEQTNFDENAHLDALFTLAMAFDDGHGLVALKYEGAWHSSRPRLFEFGGYGGFMGKHIVYSGSSSDFRRTGEEIEKAISDQDFVTAAEVIRTQVGRIVAGLACEETRTKVQLELARLLSIPDHPASSMLKQGMAMDTELLQRRIAESIFERFNFGEGVILEAANGWDWTSPGQEWSRVVFIRDQGREGPTLSWKFTIQFKPDSAIVDEAYAVDESGNLRGSYEKVEYYVWTGEGDCDNKTDQLAVAIEWCCDFNAQGKESYITNVDNEVFDLEALLKT